MFYPSTGQRVAHFALLLGSVCWYLPAAASSLQTVGVQASAVVPPALMLGKNWQLSADPADYLVSEKLDGVRAFWDGQVLRFRSGRLIAAPAWFTAGLPDTPLDGELWLARGQFDRISATVRRHQAEDAEWRELKYRVFDLPGAAGTFGERAEKIVALVGAAGVPWLQAVQQSKGTNRAALQTQLVSLTREGAEGLVLHRTSALWTPGRSDDLRKLKSVPDEDARVVSHLPGKGRHAGRLGALLLEMSNGQRFALGSGFSDAQRSDPPPVGAWVTYRYRTRTPTGLPRFASFLRVRDAE
jgi:DNA ligase-1